MESRVDIRTARRERSSASLIDPKGQVERQERRLDQALENTFPASDPVASNIFE